MNLLNIFKDTSDFHFVSEKDTHFQLNHKNEVEFFEAMECDGKEKYNCQTLCRAEDITWAKPHTPQDVEHIKELLTKRYADTKTNKELFFNHIKFNEGKYIALYWGAHDSDGGAYCYDCFNKLTEEFGY